MQREIAKRLNAGCKRTMSTYAFAEEVLTDVKIEWLKESVEAELLNWLS